MNTSTSPASTDAQRVLVLSTLAFTLLFAVWLMFGILALPIRKEFGLDDIQFAWLAAVAVLNGALWRLPFGMLTDRIGGRRMMIGLILATAIPTFLVSQATSFTQLLVCAFFIGMAGNSFSVGISWNSAWTSGERQGLALGVFGAGNVGASVTKLIAPVLLASLPAAGLLGGLVPSGWRCIAVFYGVALLMMAAAIWLFCPTEDRLPAKGRPLSQMLKPLGDVRVWRFSLYYVVVFGAYVALSVWLPKYYVDVFQMPIAAAGLLTCLFIFPASLLRPVGGWLSDKFGPRRVMYLVLIGMSAAIAPLAVPGLGLGVVAFTALLIVIGVAMGIGKAAVFKYIPNYYPKDVGAVGGLVGCLGGLGGFFLPLLFANAGKAFHLPEMTWILLLGFCLASLAWLHLVVRNLPTSAEVPASV